MTMEPLFAAPAEFMPYMDFWWLVVSDVRDGKIVVVRPAPKRKPLPMTETRIAAFVRAVAKTAGAA